MTVMEIAEEHGVSRQTIHNHRRSGAFPRPVEGADSTRPRFRADEVAAFFEANPKRPGKRTDLVTESSGEPMDLLITFLRARWDEEAQAVSAASDGPWTAWRESRLRGLGDLQHVVMLPGEKPGARASIATASWADAEHIARYNPARASAEIEAKRAVVTMFEDATRDAASPDYLLRSPARVQMTTLAPVLRLLALPYADHRDYRDEWRP